MFISTIFALLRLQGQEENLDQSGPRRLAPGSSQMKHGGYGYAPSGCPQPTVTPMNVPFPKDTVLKSPAQLLQTTLWLPSRSISC